MRSLIVLLLVSGSLIAAETKKIDRSIGKEPKYSNTPLYALLAFGPELNHRVWLVRDGDTLYVDKNANGDLTDPGEAITKKKLPKGAEASRDAAFELGDLTLGGRTHKEINLGTGQLSDMLNNFTGEEAAPFLAALKKDKDAQILSIRGEIDVPGIKGGGVGGRFSMVAGPMDLQGALVFAKDRKEAPVIHFAGPLQVTLYAQKPILRVGQVSEPVLVVGTPGIGAGTFAMLAYEGTIPENAHPKVEITFPKKTPDSPPVKQLYELKERC
jgi:hypothetical protein